MSAVVAGAQEIEVKYRVEASELPALEKALANAGAALGAGVHQDDQAYAPAGWSYGQPKLGIPFARLRTTDQRHLFTVKKPQDNELSCLEAETHVTDRDAMHQALLLAGYVPTTRIVKVRRTADLDSMSICVDDVVDAGVFVEVERVVGADHSGLEVQAELDAFVRSLGVSLERTTETYDSLVQKAAATQNQ